MIYLNDTEAELFLSLLSENKTRIRAMGLGFSSDQIKALTGRLTPKPKPVSAIDIFKAVAAQSR
jgi:hypothetical protein